MEMLSNKEIGILGTGAYLPAIFQSNEELCSLIPDLTPEWIISKTGIKGRYHIGPNESASSLALEAAQRAIVNADIEAKQIDLVIIASFSQDYLFPPMSSKVHQSLGLAKSCQIIDINTNCVGLVTALTIASERLMCDTTLQHALVIGVEVLSKFTNPRDRETAVFFSDGASAVVLGPVAQGKGYCGSKFMTDSSTYESVRMRGGGSAYPISENWSDEKVIFAEQNGLATWKQAVTNFPLVIQKLLDSQSITRDEVDFFIFHQANGFLIDYLMRKMQLPLDRTYTNVEEIGNTGSASIGIALSEAYAKGLIKSGQNLVLAGVGAGFNFGACLFKV